MKRILVIKLSALGDFVLATPAFKAIREHHKSDHITLLTTAKTCSFADENPYFDAISIDQRKSFFNPKYLLEMRRKLSGFDMVYDLQTSDRSNLYHLIAGRPQWCGIAPFCSHKQTNPNRNNMHTLDRISDQLATCNIQVSSDADISYAKEPANDLLKEHNLHKFIALVPGAAANRPLKRWPHFNELAKQLISEGHKVVLIGGPDEKELLKQLAQETGASNLGGKATIKQLIDIFSKCTIAIGNDTGPMHIAAASGAYCITLFGEDSNPNLCAPRTSKTITIHKNKIDAIKTQDVLDAFHQAIK